MGSDSIRQWVTDLFCRLTVLYTKMCFLSYCHYIFYPNASFLLTVVDHFISFPISMTSSPVSYMECSVPNIPHELGYPTTKTPAPWTIWCSHRFNWCRNDKYVKSVKACYTYLCRRRPTPLSSPRAASCWGEAPFWGMHKCRWTGGQTPGCHRKSTLWTKRGQFHTCITVRQMHSRPKVVSDSFTCMTLHYFYLAVKHQENSFLH